MLGGLETGLGLDVVIWLQAHGSPLLDALARALHYVGGNTAYLVLIALAFWSLERRLGLRLLVTLLFAVAAGEVLKMLFRAPRPYVISDEIVQLVHQEGYGLPSGHVIYALAMWGTLALWSRRRLVWAVAIGYTLLMGWARMYAGVHYPQDVIGGIAAASLILAFQSRFGRSLAEAWRKLPARVQAAVAALLSLAIALTLSDNYGALELAGIILGTGLGLVIRAEQVRFSASAGESGPRMVRALVGGVIVAIWVLGLRVLEDQISVTGLVYLLGFTAISMFIVLIWPWLCLRLGLMESAPDEAA